MKIKSIIGIGAVLAGAGVLTAWGLDRIRDLCIEYYKEGVFHAIVLPADFGIDKGYDTSKATLDAFYAMIPPSMIILGKCVEFDIIDVCDSAEIELEKLKGGCA